MNIGEEREILIVEPLALPAGLPEPERMPETLPEPEEEEMPV